MASASWCEETDGKNNYTKLCRLLVDGGTRAVRSVFDGIHPPSSLKATLNANKTTLRNLANPPVKVLNNEQWDKLYPPSGSDPKSEDFDITLLFVLLRNICGLTPPVFIPGSRRRRSQRSWDKLPHKTENSQEANLTRIKCYRNDIIAHKASTEINDADFEQHWQDISSALLSLGLSKDGIVYLKSAPLGKKDYNQLLNDWYISDKDIKTQLVEVKLDTAAIKSDIKSGTADIKSDTAAIKSDIKSGTAAIKSDIKSHTADIKSDTAAIKSDIKSGTADIKSDTAAIKSDIKSGTADIKEKLDEIKDVWIEAHKMDKLINKLAFSDFRPEISTKCKSFHPNTRQWILDQVKSHVDSIQSDSCIMLITAGPGMGKSTLAAKICQTYKDLGCLAGCHFFQFSNSTRNNPRLMLQSIARQMCDTVLGYREALESKLQTNLGKDIDSMDCEELITILLEEPLCKVEQTDSNFVVVIDALDECSRDPKDEHLKALRKKLSCLPSWLRFIITSRPSTNTSALGSTVTVEIRPEDQSNIKDLELFFNFELKARYPRYNDDNADVVQNLVELTKGLFLVAFFVIDVLKRENVAPLEKVLELFPKGISSAYENYFSRLKKVLLPYISEGERFYKMLEAVVATNNPLPKNMFYNILCLKNECEIPREEKKARKDALNALHWLFPVVGDHVVAFHKSVVDWLTLQEDEEHDFSVRVEDGNEVLANQCNDVLSDIRNGKKDLDQPLNLTDSEKYALNFGCAFIQESLTMSKGDKKEIFSNIYILTAMTITYSFDNIGKLIDVEFSRLLENGLSNLDVSRFHNGSCRFFHHAPFIRYFEFVLQAAHALGVPVHEGVSNEIAGDALRKYHFPYYDKMAVPEILMSSNVAASVDCIDYLLKCKEGFVVVFYLESSNSLETAAYKFHLDGHLIRSKSFLGKRLITTAPNINLIVVAEENGNKIEILDVRTLEVVNQYEFSHDSIETCHVFVDDQGCFLVIKGCHDNRVYVIEGLTGEVRNTITVTEDSHVEAVSRQGHIIVRRIWTRVEAKEIKKYGTQIAESMNWETHELKDGSSELPDGKLYLRTFCREMSLYHYEHVEKPTVIYPPAEKNCQCFFYEIQMNSMYSSMNETSKFSEDGRLLAYHYKDSIFLINTTDGSMFKRLSFNSLLGIVHFISILFVSERYVIMHERNSSSLLVGDVTKDELKNIFPFPPSYSSIFFLCPEEIGEPLAVVMNLDGISRLVFHNLRLKEMLNNTTAAEN